MVTSRCSDGRQGMYTTQQNWWRQREQKMVDQFFIANGNTVTGRCCQSRQRSPPSKSGGGRHCRKCGCSPRSFVWELHSWGRAVCYVGPTALRSACLLPGPWQALPPIARPAHICPALFRHVVSMQLVDTNLIRHCLPLRDLQRYALPCLEKKRKEKKSLRHEAFQPCHEAWLPEAVDKVKASRPPRRGELPCSHM